VIELCELHNILQPEATTLKPRGNMTILVPWWNLLRLESTPPTRVVHIIIGLSLQFSLFQKFSMMGALLPPAPLS
jgi:hypothetical protein